MIYLFTELFTYVLCEFVMIKIIKSEKTVQIRHDLSLLFAVMTIFFSAVKINGIRTDFGAKIVISIFAGILLFEALCDLRNKYIYSVFMYGYFFLSAGYIIYSKKLDLISLVMLICIIGINIIIGYVLKMYGNGDTLSFIAIVINCYMVFQRNFIISYFIIHLLALILFLFVNFKDFFRRKKGERIKHPLVPEILIAYLVIL